MSKLYTIDDCQLIQLSKISDPRGSLTHIEGLEHISFEIRRVYYIYDIPAGSQRAGHAHKNLFQLLISLSGSFDVHLNDGFTKRTITLNHPYEGLIITPNIWRDIDNFSSGTVCLALASEKYDHSSYYHSYDEFLGAVYKARENAVISNK